MRVAFVRGAFCLGLSTSYRKYSYQQKGRRLQVCQQQRGQKITKALAKVQPLPILMIPGIFFLEGDTEKSNINLVKLYNNWIVITLFKLNPYQGKSEITINIWFNLKRFRIYFSVWKEKDGLSYSNTWNTKSSESMQFF